MIYISTTYKRKIFANKQKLYKWYTTFIVYSVGEFLKLLQAEQR